MKKEKVWDIYTSDYAANYNDTFLLDPYSKAGADFELSIIKQLINDDTEWLDIACGTGYFLSQFPRVQRAGYDLSPAMLAEAKRVNPNALFFRQGDFRVDIPEWYNKWSLLTCMWSAYCYVETVAEVEKLIDNMIKWTSEGGSIFIPIVDLEDLRVINVPYEEPNAVYDGVTYITSCTWTWIEKDTSKFHQNMVAPHVEHFIRLLQPFFETIELVYYPVFQSGWGAKKALVAKNKVNLQENPSHVAKVIRHPVPADSYQAHQVAQINNLQTNQTNLSPSSLSNKQLINEIYLRVKNGYLPKSLAKKILQKIKS
jgi:SAM-dependent methyltransferase